jgi:tetratricopeptide (TPR) repeat protein
MMKFSYPVFIVLVLSLAPAGWAQSPDDLFQKANGLYQEGKVAEARDLYESIAANGYVSGELYYNLGNAHYRLGDPARAILNYERALRLMPGDDDLRNNLQVANLRVIDRIEPTPRLFLWDYWDGVKGALSTRGVVWTAYGLFVAFSAAVILFLIGRTYAFRKASVIAATVSGLLLGSSLILLYARVSDDNRSDEAIVLVNLTTVKNSPDARSSDAFVLHAGVKVRVIDAVNEWLKIRLADGKVGWMERSAAETI